MKRTIIILLGGLLVASPAYADETNENFDNNFDNNDDNLNDQSDPNDRGDQNNQNDPNDFNPNESYDSERDENGFNNEEENYEEPPAEDNYEPPVEDNYEPPIEDNYEPPLEEAPVTEEPAEEESSSIVTKVKQDSYSISGTVFVNDKKVPAKLEVGGKTFETKQPGEFKIEGLQPGKHTIKVVEADGKSVGKTVDVEITDKDKINIDIKISEEESENEEETIQKDDPEVKETSKALIFSVVGVIILTIIGVIALVLRNRK